jgi:acyltransferase
MEATKRVIGKDQRIGEARPRSVAIDVVRVVGVAAVVIGHLYGGQADNPNAVRALIYSWQVPIFFFLTGYLWTRGRAFRPEVRARARSLLLPYLSWSILLGVPVLTVATIASGFPTPTFLSTLWGGGLLRGVFAPYWFLPLLFFVAVALRGLERLPRWVSWMLALAGLGASYLFGTQLSLLPHDVFFTLPCMLFALAGQEVRRVESAIPKRGLIGLALLAAGLGAFASHVIAPLDMKLGYFGTPVVSVGASIAICVGLIFVARAVFDGRQILGASIITEMALTSVVVLLTHTFAFSIPAALGAPSIVILFFALIACWALALLVHRTPLSVPLAGLSQLRRT